MSETKPGLIYEIMPKIMAAIAPISKDSENKQQGYKFRGIDSVYNFIQPILAANGLFIRSEIQDVQRSERPSKSGGVMTFVQIRSRYYIVAPDGSSIWSDAIGESMDSGDKSVPKAMSVAQKYFFLQTFCIPTEDPKDVENDDPQPTPKPTNGVSQSQGKPAEPPKQITAAQVTEIADCVTNYVTLTGKKPEDIAASIVSKIKKQFSIDIKDPSTLTEAQAAWLIKALWKAVEFEGARKMKEIEDKMKALGSKADAPGTPGPTAGASGDPGQEDPNAV
jgi:hypothetical protein